MLLPPLWQAALTSAPVTPGWITDEILIFCLCPWLSFFFSSIQSHYNKAKSIVPVFCNTFLPTLIPLRVKVRVLPAAPQAWCSHPRPLESGHPEPGCLSKSTHMSAPEYSHLLLILPGRLFKGSLVFISLKCWINCPLIGETFSKNPTSESSPEPCSALSPSSSLSSSLLHRTPCNLTDCIISSFWILLQEVSPPPNQEFHVVFYLILNSYKIPSM